jgi:hypothetical protein
MNFIDYTYEQLDGHIMSKFVFEEDEMSPLLKGHIFIEKCLDVLLIKNFPNPNVFFKKTRSFELKLDIAFSMGLFDESYYSAFKCANKIRNDYAHEHNYTLVLESLNGLKLNWTDLQKETFQVACSKSNGEGLKIAILFLCWSAIGLIKTPKDDVLS